MGKTFTKNVLAFLALFTIIFYSGCGKTSTSQKDLNEQSVLALLWYQSSAEMRALSYQAFNLARLRFDQDLEREHDKKRAVVVDIDETVLDNSPWQAGLVGTEKSFPEGWENWCRSAEAKALPGAVEFLEYIVSKGADVFYVSNRSVQVKSGTMANLKAAGFPQVEESHMLLKETDSDKEPRRQRIEETHQIVLLIGDNLGDFDAVFYKKGSTGRAGAVDQLKNRFGQKYIMLPNPMYGDWEGAVYRFRYDLSPAEKSQARKSALTPWSPPN